jgi:hypothetical protein
MKYKISKGTKLFQALTAVKLQMDAVDKLAEKIVQEAGADSYAKASQCIAGGIRAFYFKDLDKVPVGWKKMEKGLSHWFFPKSSAKANRDLLERIADLPTMGTEDIAKLLNFHAGVYGEIDRMIWVSCPQVRWAKTYVVVAVPESIPYTPVKEMQEITVSMYNKLAGKGV